MNKIAIVVPSRGRPQQMRQLISSWILTGSNKSEIIMGLDGDDPTLPDYPAGIKIVTTPAGELNEKNNRLVMSAIIRGHEIVGCLSDDFIFHTPGWEDIVIKWQEENRGICYGNDLLQGPNLPTAPFIHKDIIIPLGYAAPPELIHYFIDNYWLELGIRLGRLSYLSDIIIEHKHWSNGKSQKDEIYSSSEKVMNKDRAVWDEYRFSKLQADVDKILSLTN